MKPLVLDVETNPNAYAFNPNERLHMVGLRSSSGINVYDVEYSQKPYGDILKSIQSQIDDADIIVAFNAKFDLHWCRRYGIRFHHKKLWDLQYAEYCMSGQQWAYPDLDTSCKLRGIEGKSDWIATNYWEKGVKTTEIPWNELATYNEQDLKCEWDLFHEQVKVLQANPKLKRLIWYGCQDILVTEEMEANGIKYNVALSLREGEILAEESRRISDELYSLVVHSRDSGVDWNSPANLSAVLYGGIIKQPYREEYEFRYRDGRVAVKSRNSVRQVAFPRIVQPLKGSENTHGWSTDEGTLKRLKPSGTAKQVISHLLRKRELDKKVSTYYHGLPKLIGEMQWENETLHGQLNHCRAATGRLASSKPNQQNLDYKVRECIVSRFPMMK